MKHLKLYESFNNIESTKEELYDLFINFEDEGWTVKPLFSKIVKDRNDWSGNLRSTKVRNVWGGEFIDWHEEVIMSDGDKKWKAVDCFVVNMSKIHYIENLTEESIVEHWKDLDSYLTSKIPVIKERAKRLGLELLGVVGKWFTLGKASHSDYSNEPYFGWDMLTDLISFAFVPIKTNEGLFDKVYSNMNPINNIGGKWNKESVFGMNLNIQPRVYIKRSLVDPTLEKISKLSKRWNLVYNSVDLYRVGKDHFIKFRFSDIEGDSDYGTESGPIPIDIGEEIISEVKSELGDFVVVEDFDDRGYIHFNISLEMIGKRIDEGLFDLFKRYKDYFTEEESVKIESQLCIQQLVKWTPVLEGHKIKGHKIKSIEIYIGAATRSSLSPQYLLITKQDSQYKLITFQDVDRFADDNTTRLNRYKSLDEVILEAKKYIMCCLVAPFISKPTIFDFKWNGIQVIKSQFDESKSLIEDYSVLKNDNKLNLERLNMLLDDYSISHRMRNNEDRLISILKNYFK
jgi:hypothetical protein